MGGDEATRATENKTRDQRDVVVLGSRDADRRPVEHKKFRY
jgi:hypothetical protein